MYSLAVNHGTLSDEQVSELVHQALADPQFNGQRILVLIPDGTRTAPIPQMFRLLHQELGKRVMALDFLIALGTHNPMSESQINRLVGVTQEERETTFKNVQIFNHLWHLPDTFISCGMISADEIAEISGGMLHQEVNVRVNKLVTEYDLIIICGPVFPHEVVGFSGGNKYFFPGISGQEVINLSHWLGALITCYEIIGTQGITPVRRLINRATSLIPTPKLCLAMVVAPGTNQLAGLYIDKPEAAWQNAAELSAKVHIKYVDRPFKQVLSVMPEMYDDIWTAAKGMYKLEPIVADGGEVIIYAPHITEFSYTYGEILAHIGYHVRDYFLKQWDKFSDYPAGVLAHSTHLKGMGTFDPIKGEQARIRVTLATGISPERCAAHNLNYRNPATIQPVEWANREDEGILLVPKAGEILYRLK
ncbi:MAG: lactate racemase domain-containing protein [Aulosira sp. ZfuVER01]|nr:lactate racemase domain-containing protein [Aulosira sp. ZfuVER01]MDZ7999914.1 lactate racemase domain-containing protein [Aulosira sp. DedVER01a]MDZ8051351.1 lactate racemase domain-containing protein [Aulosira sp. ZfuCHP01]